MNNGNGDNDFFIHKIHIMGGWSIKCKTQISFSIKYTEKKTDLLGLYKNAARFCI